MIAIASEYAEWNLRDLHCVCAFGVSERVIGYSGITIDTHCDRTDGAVVPRSMVN
jgi:hypothetical protein